MLEAICFASSQATFAPPYILFTLFSSLKWLKVRARITVIRPITE